MHRPAAALVVGAIAVAGLAVACGGSDSNRPASSTSSRSTDAPLSDQAYSEALAAGEKKVATAEQAARNQASPKTPLSKITPLLDAWATALDSAADDLAGITPPTKAADANDHLVTALHDFATDLRSTIDKMQSSNKPWLKVLTSTMSQAKGPQELDAAVKELNSLGFGSGSTG